MVQSGFVMKVLYAVIVIAVFVHSGVCQDKPEVFVQTGHIGEVTAIASTADGKYCISYCPWTGLSEPTLKLWDVQSGREMKTLLIENTFGMVFIDFSPDGSQVLVLENDEIAPRYGTLQIINTVTGTTKTMNVKRGSNKPVTAAISADNKTVCVLYSSAFLGKSELKSFEIVTGKELETITGGLYVARFLPPGSRYYLRYDKDLDQYSPDNTTTYWLSALANGAKSINVRLNKNSYPEFNSAFSKNGKNAVFFSGDGAYFLDCTEGTVVKIATRGYLELFDISPDGRYFLTFLPAKEIGIYDSHTGKNIQTITGSFHSAVFSPNGNTVLTGDKSGNVSLYDITSGQRTRSFGTKPRNQKSLAISFDRYLISLCTLGSDKDWSWFVWDLHEASLLKVINNELRSKEVLPYAEKGSINNENATPRIMAALNSTSANKNYTASFSDAAYGVKILEATSKKEIAQCTAFDDGEWIIMTPEGYFNASPNGAKHINVRVGGAVYSVDNFYEKFFNPQYVASVLQGRKVDAVADIRKGILLPPEVKIISPEPGKEYITETLTVVVSAKDMGGGIDEIRLFQNEKLISEDQRGMKNVAAKGENLTKSYQVTLLSGINTFRAIAFNRERTESNPVEIKVDLKALQAASDLYLVAIGINEYKNPKYNLNFGKSDAMAFLNTVVQKSRTIFKKAFQYQLYDGQATRPALEAIFRTIAATAKPQDAFVFFYAGHGVMSEGSDAVPSDFYLIPADVTQLYGNDEMLASKAISAAQLKTFCTTIKAQKQLVILDACQSGGAVESFAMRGAPEERAIMQLARSAGTYLLASTGTEQFATEFSTLAHGVFTYALLQGLNGEADGGNPKDGKITVKELEAYLNDQVPELTKKYRGTAQYPSGCARGQDFPLGVK